MDTNTNQDLQVEIQNQNQEYEVKIDSGKVERYFETLKLEQNLPFGTITALAASVIGAVAWAAITVVSNFQIGWMAVAIGFIVGYGMRIGGKGIDKIFGYIGAVLSLFGCLLGNFLSVVGFVANQEGLGYFEVLNKIDYSLVPQILLETGSPMDLLFYGIAVYEGYKFSFRKITENDIMVNTAS